MNKSAPLWVAGLMVVLGVPGAIAADVPRASAQDTRIRVVRYQPQNVTKIFVQRGVVTRVVLEEGERIMTSVVGLSADCKAANDEWCISADSGGNQIFVRPRDAARKNNIEIRTDKRDYSIEFDVLADQAPSTGAKASFIPAFYRVTFEYDKPVPVSVTPLSPERAEAMAKLQAALSATTAPAVSRSALLSPQARLLDEPVGVVRNANYSKQVLPNGADAEPSAVFDDGRFTYFEFVGAREIPAVFAHSSDGEPARVNWHMQAPFLVVQQIAKKFTLRIGGAVVGIFNNAYDATGIETPNSTVSEDIERVIKRGAGQ